MKKTKFTIGMIAITGLMLLVAAPVHAKELLKIKELWLNGKCAKKDSIVTVVLNKKIFRGINVVSITGKKTHYHPRINKWRFRANEIKLQIPAGPTLRAGHKYKVVIERRAPHRQISVNTKRFRVCWR